MAEATKAIVEVKKLEEQLAAARETARTAFLVQAQDALMNLKAIGFEYEIAEKGAVPARRLGRPRKEAKQNGEEGKQ